MPHEAPLLEQITQSPLLIDPACEGLFQKSLAHLVNHADGEKMLGYAADMRNEDEDFWPADGDWRQAYRPYNVKNGILQIPVMGVLLNRFPFQFGRWATGYAYIEKAVERGLRDPTVRGIALVEDSPGGEVAGCFECADKIYEARPEKPIRAFAADHAYSAAYAIACSAKTIVVTRSGGVGSIGVVTAHVEYSKMLEEWGIKVTFIFAGKHKVDGNSYEKLPDDVKARIQKRIDRIYGVFTSTVARNRGMEEKAVKDTQALTYDANDSLEVGLADKIGSLEDEMVIFSTDAEAENEQMATFTQEQHDKAIADARADEQAKAKAAQDAAVATASTAARERISAIMGCEEAKSRPIAANNVALNTDMTLAQAQAFLKGMPEEKAAAPEAGKGDDKAKGKDPFESTMEKDNPEVGAAAPKSDDARSDDVKAADSILADFAGASGRPRKAAA